MKEQVFRLRFHVYCLETGFENPENFPDGLEKDEYDDQSEHYLIQHTVTGKYAATTRLILPDPRDLSRLFPTEIFTAIERREILQAIPRLNLAEASRFCVSKDFKRRSGEAGTLAGIPRLAEQYEFKADERRTFPLITLALFAALVRMSVEHDITHWCAAMEPSLPRFFCHIGIYFTSIGPVKDYHGLRAPYIIEVQHLLDDVKRSNIQAWNLITDYGNFSVSKSDRLFFANNMND